MSGHMFLDCLLLLVACILGFIGERRKTAAADFKQKAEHWLEQANERGRRIAILQADLYELEDKRVRLDQQVWHMTNSHEVLKGLDKETINRMAGELDALKKRLQTQNIEELQHTVALAPESWSQPEPTIRYNIESMILRGLVEQMKPFITFDGPIYTPFQLPKIIGRLKVVKGDIEQNERQETESRG